MRNLADRATWEAFAAALRAVAHPDDPAQFEPEPGALPLDGDQLPLGVLELPLEVLAFVAGDAELVVAVTMYSRPTAGVA